jgi:hypothetical protein
VFALVIVFLRLWSRLSLCLKGRVIMCLDQGQKKKLSERRGTGLHVKGLSDGETITFGINSGEGSAHFSLSSIFRCIKSQVCSK